MFKLKNITPCIIYTPCQNKNQTKTFYKKQKQELIGISNQTKTRSRCYSSKIIKLVTSIIITLYISYIICILLFTVHACSCLCRVIIMEVVKNLMVHNAISIAVFDRLMWLINKFILMFVSHTCCLCRRKLLRLGMPC